MTHFHPDCPECEAELEELEREAQAPHTWLATGPFSLGESMAIFAVYRHAMAIHGKRNWAELTADIFATLLESRRRSQVAA